MTDTPRRQVVVDTDTGLDDALALLLLAGSPHADIAAVTTVYGNCVVEDSLRNAAHVLRLAGLDDVPLSRGAAGPLVGRPTSPGTSTAATASGTSGSTGPTRRRPRSPRPNASWRSRTPSPAGTTSSRSAR